MEALPAILDSMRVSLAVIALLVACGVAAMTLMLHLQSRILRDLPKRVADTEAALPDRA
jgi:hypothetical protein